MRNNLVTITRPEGKLFSNEYYDNDHITKPIIFGKWKYGHQLIQTIDSREGKKIHQSTLTI